MPNFAISLSLVLVTIGLLGCSAAQPASESSVDLAFRLHQSNVQVSGEGVVDRILRDDNSGLRHQRFVVKTASGRTVLVEHNTDVAPRIDEMHVGDSVSFSGEYIWNEQGGLVHWTHHDPAGRHADGWVRLAGRTFQ